HFTTCSSLQKGPRVPPFGQHGLNPVSLQDSLEDKCYGFPPTYSFWLSLILCPSISILSATLSRSFLRR
ncbi:MAG: hypothetical protein P8Y00_08185, partial [Deltaproteobacteria bacterium]